MNRSKLSLVALGLLLAATPALASSVTTYDASVTPQDGSGNLYFGSGNANGGFTVNTNYGIEVGLRAKYRSNGNIINSPDNNYSVVTGAQTDTTSGGNGANANRAAWSYEFSVDVDAASPTYGLAQTFNTGFYKTIITITDNIGDTPVSFDALVAIGDNGGPNSGVIQNSENIAFYPANFNFNNEATYKISMSVQNKQTGFEYANSTINVAAVAPLPASFYSGIGMLGLLGVGVMFRNRKSRLA